MKGVTFMLSSNEKVKNFRKNRKQNLVKISGNKCNICGYNKAISALEFHHINPEEKTYGLAQNGTCHSLQKDLNELQKCILVCANCHREIHEGFYSKQQLLSLKIVDEQYKEFLIQDNNKKMHKQKRYCQDCGKELSYSTKGNYCSNCRGTHNRKYERPSRQELKQKIRTMPLTKVAEFYNVSDIRKWCDGFNLPRTKKEINSYNDEEWQKI